MTPQRRAVMDVLQGAGLHPDPAWVHREARQVMPDITLATVQRTLSLLREAGLLDEMPDQALHERAVDGRPGANGMDAQVSCHASCVRCHCVVDVGTDVCEDLMRAVASTTGFVITGTHLRLHGLCPDCAQERDKG